MKQNGFTLIELLVVISIVALLSSILIANLNYSITLAKDSAIKSQMKEIQKYAALYFSRNNTYVGLCADGTFSTMRGRPYYRLYCVDPTYSRDRYNAGISSWSGPMNYPYVEEWSSCEDLYLGGGWCVDSSGKSEYINQCYGSILFLTRCP